MAPRSVLHLLLAALLGLIGGGVHREVVRDRAGEVVPRPRNLRQAILALDRVLDEETRAEQRAGSDTREARVGFWIRNHWGLWSGSALQRWYSRRGVGHPEHISGFIVGRYVRYLRGKPLEVAARMPLDFGERLAARGDELLLYDRLSVYARDDAGWRAIYTHADGPPDRYRDQSLDHEDDAAWSLPRSADTPRMLGAQLWFSGLDSRGEPRIVRLDTNDPRAPLADFEDLYVIPYFGRGGAEVVDLVPTGDGGLWVTSGFSYGGALFEIRGEVDRLHDRCVPS